MKVEKLRKGYDQIVVILALVSIGLAAADLTKGLSKPWQVIDVSIYWLFFGDYMVRLYLSTQRKTFVKENIPDLIAILPFNSALRAFRSFRLLKIGKLVKVTKIARAGAITSRGWKKARSFLNTNGLKYVLIITAVAILAGAVGISIAEDMAVPDALWWSFVTATTVGYGDLSPSTNAGRIMAAMLMLVGIGLIGSLTSSITSWFLNQNKSESASTDKVDMVLTMYDSLTDAEKEMFLEHLES